MAFDNFYYKAQRVYIAKRDVNGYAKGQLANPDSVDVSSNSVESSALIINTPVTFTPPAVTRAEYKDKSGGQLWQTIDGGVDDIATGTLVFSRESSALNTLVASLGTDTTQSTSFEQGGVDPTVQQLNNLWIGFERLVSDYDGTTFTTGRPSIEWYAGTLSLPTRPEANNNTGINPQSLTYVLTAQRFSKFLTGGLLSAITNAAYQSGSTLVHKMDVVYPNAAGIIVHTAVMDGTDTSFTLPYRPLSNSATTGAGNLIFKNGTATAVTSVNTTTGVVTLAAAGASGDIWEFIGPTNFVAI